MAISYDIEIKPTGGSATLYTDITGNSYAATGLTASTDYEWRIRQVDTGTHGGVMYSLWSAWDTFSTTAEVSSTPIYLTFNVASEVGTALTLSSDIIIPVDPLDPIPATSWDVEVEDLTTNIVTSYTNLTVKTLNLTGLSPHSEYRFRVKGFAESRTVEGDFTDWFVFITATTPATFGTVFTLSTQDLDVFHVGITDFSLLGGYVTASGTATHNCNVQFSIEGINFQRDVIAPIWNFNILVDPSPQVRYIETYDELLDSDDPSYFLIEGYGQVSGDDTILT